VYQVGKVYTIGTNNETYNFVKYHHQIKNPKKSWWIISLTKEADLFEDMTKNKYISNAGDRGYNVKCIGNKLELIGTDITRQDLQLAKYIFNKINWHGYPANHKINQDRPEDEVMEKFLNNGLNPSIYRKIKKGQKI